MARPERRLKQNAPGELYVDDTCIDCGLCRQLEHGSGLDASRDVCWYSWPRQVESLRRLREFRFSWVLPGHGSPYRAESPEAMRNDLETLLRRIEREG